MRLPLSALLLIPLTTAPVAPLVAQAPPPAVSDSIMVPIRAMFRGMYAHDSAMVRSAFVPGAQFSRPPRPGRPHAFTSVDQFAAAVGRPGEPWDEQIYNIEIQEDAGMAAVWTFFRFSLGTKFSHCGVNAFLLVRTGEGWKISGLADSNRTTDCDVPSGG